MRRWNRVAFIAATITLAGCSPSTTPSVSPAPSYSCTPEVGGPSYRCTQTDYDQMKHQDALYAEGEDVFRRFIAEDERTYRGGGSSNLSDEYRKILGTETLRQEQLEINQSLKANRQTAAGGIYQATWIHRVVGQSVAGSAVTVRGCVDLSTVRYYTRGKYDANGLKFVRTLFLGTTLGSLKVLAIKSKLVDEC